jgi:hypothetical protein
MPGYNATQLLYKVQNANACSILLGDVVVGFGQTLAPNIDFGTEGLYGVGSAKPQEIQQLRFTNTITLDSYRLTREGNAFFGVTQALWTLLANNYFDFYLLGDDGTAFIAYVGAVAQTNNLNIAANTPLTEGMTFLALDVLDSNGVSVLNSNSTNIFNPLASSVAIPLVTPGG